jgi:hypothetical protein
MADESWLKNTSSSLLREEQRRILRPGYFKDASSGDRRFEEKGSVPVGNTTNTTNTYQYYKQVPIWSGLLA